MGVHRAGRGGSSVFTSTGDIDAMWGGHEGEGEEGKNEGPGISSC